IGEAARIGGQVALAVACARHLADLGSMRGPELIDQIIDTYATGGPHFAFTPPRARAATEPPDLADPVDDPVDEVRAVIERYGSWLVSLQPKAVPPAPLLSALSPSG